MPEMPNPKTRPHAARAAAPRVKGPYAELQVTSNFSFLRGGSHPEELIIRAAESGCHAVGITDINSLAGIVRAHEAAGEAGIPLAVGCHLQVKGAQGACAAGVPADPRPLSLLAYP